jgi:hypothetical protein
VGDAFTISEKIFEGSWQFHVCDYDSFEGIFCLIVTRSVDGMHHFCLILIPYGTSDAIPGPK